MNKLPFALFAPLLGSAAVWAAEPALEETLVEGQTNKHEIVISERSDFAPDSAQLLSKAPGATANGNGPLTGIPQVRGMYGARVGVTVNGQSISAGGPNWMDPPLSYAPAAQLETLTVYRGIAPVSVGQETIGGAIDAQTWQGQFARTDTLDINGNINLGAQSGNNATLASANLAVASRAQKLKLQLLSESADDAPFPDGDLHPTEYQRDRADLGYSLKHGKHQWSLDLARSNTGTTGTPALPMDIGYIDSDLFNLSYRYQGDWQIEAQAYGSNIDHGMTNYASRQPPMMPTMYRRNTATGENRGFKLQAQQGKWTLGADYHDELHNSDIDNPNAPAFFVINFNDASRTVSGVFAEYSAPLGALSSEVGVRVNRVAMDAADVDGTPAMMMPAAATLRDNFNIAERSQSDTNLDAVIRLHHSNGWYGAIGQKTRSPSYQERYLWLPMESTAGLADGRVYIGNTELKPEKSHELELGYDWQSGRFSASPRVYYRKVSDYIQGTESTSMAAVMVVEMMGMNPYKPLQFNNVDAEFYGFDMDARYTINAHWEVQTLLNSVRGKRTDIDDNLYRIAPDNATLALNFAASGWGASAQTRLFAGQREVSVSQGEKPTAGYAIANISAYWQPVDTLKLTLGVNNLFDKSYQDHLAGYNRVSGADIATGERLYGYARHAYLRLSYQL